MKTIAGNWILKRILFLILTFAINYAVYYSYKNIFSVSFYYLRFYYFEKENFEIVLAFIYALIPVLFINTELKKPSDILILFLYLFSYGPAIIIGFVCSTDSFFNSITYFNVLLCCMMGLILLKRANIILPPLRIGGWDPRFFVALLIFIDLAALVYLSTQFSFGDFSELARLDVYETRSQVKSQLADPISPYLFGLVAYVTGPFLIAFGLLSRRYWLLIIGIASNLMIFGLQGSKTAVFLIPFVIILHFLIKARTSHAIYLSLLILIVLIFSVWIDSVSSLQISSYLNRRVFAVPGLLTRVYYDIFSVEPTYNWTYSFLRFFEKSIHDLTPPHLIGKYYFGDVNMSANANVWADGFANNIPFGPYLITFFMLLLFWFVDNVSDKNPRLALLVFASTIYPFTNSSFFTSLMTHGFLWSLVLFVLAPAENKMYSQKFSPEGISGSVLPSKFLSEKC
jgi:hypothetical protein